MGRWILRIGSLYLALVATSAVIIALTLKAHPLAALGTAAIGCLFKTAAAAAHEWFWDRLDHPAKAAKAIEPAPVHVTQVLIELDASAEVIPFPVANTVGEEVA